MCDKLEAEIEFLITEYIRRYETAQSRGEANGYYLAFRRVATDLRDVLDGTISSVSD